MKPIEKVILFFVLPIIAVLMFPPNTILSGIPLIMFVIAAFVLLGWALWTGRNWALTLSIFIQGFNVIVRLMMFLSTSVSAAGVWNIPFIITSVIAIGLSLWLLLRLDKVDVHTAMVR